MDKKLENILLDMVNLYDTYMSTHGLNFTYAGTIPQNIHVPVLGEVPVCLASRTNSATINTDDYYRALLNSFCDSFNLFTEYVKNIKFELDVLY